MTPWSRKRKSDYIARHVAPTHAGDAEFETYIEHQHLIECGLLDEGQPTRWSHLQARRDATKPFDAYERAQIRDLLGLHGAP